MTGLRASFILCTIFTSTLVFAKEVPYDFEANDKKIRTYIKSINATASKADAAEAEAQWANKVVRKTCSDLVQMLDRHNSQLSELGKSCADLDERIKEQQILLTEDLNKKSGLSSELEGQKKALVKLKANREALLAATDAELVGQIANLRKEVSKSQAEKDSLQKRADSLKEKGDRLYRDCMSQRAFPGVADMQACFEDKAYLELKKQYQEIMAFVEKHAADIAGFKVEIANLQTLRVTKKQELAAMLDKQMMELRSKIKALTSDHEASEKRVLVLKSDILKLREKLKKLNSTFDGKACSRSGAIALPKACVFERTEDKQN